MDFSNFAHGNCSSISSKSVNLCSTFTETGILVIRFRGQFYAAFCRQDGWMVFCKGHNQLVDNPQYPYRKALVLVVDEQERRRDLMFKNLTHQGLKQFNVGAGRGIPVSS